ncbi:DUF4198 domain-containing protein [Asticcacaulis sp.]|uniref:DUF4198 domain-containing protein n=1 Tax=Asticcacaulis sp. TaxID=1872648 RepID=UPI0031E29469
MTAYRFIGITPLLFFGLLTAPALAHSPYLRPAAFSVPAPRDHVTIEAAFSDGDLRPDVAMKSDGFHILAPDGTDTPLPPAATLKDAVFLEAPLKAEGTYLISSGVRKGRVAKGVLRDGEVHFLEGPNTARSGETVIDVQSLTRADVYVTHGRPSRPDFRSDGVELFPVTAPYDAYAGEPFTVRVRENGQGLSGQGVTIITDGQTYATPRVGEQTLRTNDAGEVTFTPKTAGLYLLQVRVRRPAEGQANLWLSHTATLTLEVLPQ